MTDLQKAPTRPASRVRVLRTSIRAAHTVAVATFYGGQVYRVPDDRLGLAWIAVIGTGLAFAMLEISRTPVWAVQVRGVAVYLKIALMLGAGAWPMLRVPLLTLALVIGVVVSHMPGRYRYYSLFHGRMIGHDDKG